MQIYLTIPVEKQLKPVHWQDVGLVKRIRGVAYSTRCSPQNANRLVRAHTPRRLGACEGDTLGARERAMLGAAMSRFRSLSLLKPSSQESSESSDSQIQPVLRALCQPPPRVRTVRRWMPQRLRRLRRWYSDEKVASREIRAWHVVIENG